MVNDQGTCMGSYANLLEHRLYGNLEIVDTLQTNARVHLMVTPTADAVIYDLGTFSFLEAHRFSAGGVHRLIEIMEDISI